MTQQWQAIDSAPKDGTRIYASGLDSGKGPTRHHAVVWWTDGEWYCDCDGQSCYGHLTHWQPLPEPPP